MNTSPKPFLDTLVHAAAHGDAAAVADVLAHTAGQYNFQDLCGINNALLVAAQHGHAQCVSLLFPHSYHANEDGRALAAAAQHGHTECVKLLVNDRDAKCNNSEALYRAARNGHVACVAVLYGYSDVEAVAARMSQGTTTTFSFLALQKMIVAGERKLLAAAVGDAKNGSTSRSRRKI